MRKPEDAIALRELLDTGAVKRAVVCGAGFIGLEVAENLAAKGVKVSVIDMAEQITAGLRPRGCGLRRAQASRQRHSLLHRNEA